MLTIQETRLMHAEQVNAREGFEREDERERAEQFAALMAEWPVEPMLLLWRRLDDVLSDHDYELDEAARRASEGR